MSVLVVQAADIFRVEQMSIVVSHLNRKFVKIRRHTFVPVRDCSRKLDATLHQERPQGVIYIEFKPVRNAH